MAEYVCSVNNDSVRLVVQSFGEFLSQMKDDPLGDEPDSMLVEITDTEPAGSEQIELSRVTLRVTLSRPQVAALVGQLQSWLARTAPVEARP
jgi:hypothetical protein